MISARMRRFLPAVLLPVVAATMWCLAAPASADAGASITLAASPRAVEYGGAVRFSGQISPPSGGQVVDVVDGHGSMLAETTTGVDGTYRARAVPGRSARVHAQWGTVTSH